MPQISARKLFTEGQTLHNKTITFEAGKILSIEDCPTPPEFDCLSPAFFDTHINGGEEYYLTQSNNEEAIKDIFDASVQTGTYYVLPTVITSSPENILKGIDEIRKYRINHPQSGVVGLHLEGPFLNPLKRGAHLAKYVRKPTDSEIQEILEAGKDVIKIWTIAPEQFTPDQLQMVISSGITISAGHSNATYEEASEAFVSGISLVTHLYNAMSSFHHRKPGLIGAALSHPQVWAPIILDGKHCHFGAAQTAWQAKPDRLFLISDALFLGRKKQDFRWEEFDARLVNGEYVNSEGNLAGSAVSMGECIYNAVNLLKIPLEIAVSMATDRPAKAVRMEHVMGKLEQGYPAVFSVFDDELTSFQVKAFPE